jgi:hypothetical protein
VTSLDDLVAVRRTAGGPWLERGRQAGVCAMGTLARTSDAAARAWHGVHSVGVGPKIVCGRPTSTPAIRFYVVQKVSGRALSSSQAIPRRLDGLPVDVVESPPAFVRNDATAAARRPRTPMCAGISIGGEGVPFGTFGAFCRSLLPEDDGRVLVLSNRHVLAGPAGQPSSPVFQPGRDDTVGQLRVVGTLLRARNIEPGIIANRIDAAVATVADRQVDLSLPGDAGKVLSVGLAHQNTIVCKFGRTTGFTEGVVTDLHNTAVVGLDPRNPSLAATFIDQIRIDRRLGAPIFADAGDSGAVILEQGTGRVVGLFFAGPVDGSYGLANHIGDVVDRLQIEILT